MQTVTDEDVAIVHRHGSVPDADLTGPGRADLDILPSKNFRAAGFVEPKCFGHVWPPGQADDQFWAHAQTARKPQASGQPRKRPPSITTLTPVLVFNPVI